MKKEFIASTIGMMAKHDNMHSPKLVRVEYYRTANGIELHVVSGRNLARIRNIPTVLISKDEFNDRDYDQCNDTTEFFWALGKCGFDFSSEIV